MKESINYIILPELKLILECCKGQASVESIINRKKDELLDELYYPDYNILVDFREFENFNNSTYSHAISDFINFLKQLEIKSRVAFLTSELHQVVLSLLLEKLSKDVLTSKYETFSTMEAAIRFLGYSIDSYDIIRKRIIELNSMTTFNE